MSIGTYPCTSNGCICTEMAGDIWILRYSKPLQNKKGLMSILMLIYEI